MTEKGLHRTTVCRWLVLRPHYSARVMHSGSRGPTEFFFFPSGMPPKLIQLFSSNRFQASLVSFGYLAFCLLFLPLPCCYFSFVASFFCLFIACCAVWNGLLVPLSLTRLLVFYLMDVFHLHVSFSCYYFSRVDLRLYNSERRELSTGRVCFVKLWLSGPRSPQNSRRS